MRPVLGLSHIFKVPTIAVSSFRLPLNSHEIVGAPFHPFQYPAMIRERIYNLTIWEKVVQLYKEIQYYLLIKSIERTEDFKIKQLFGSDIPTLSELYDNIEMLFVNVHPIWEDNRPVPPNVIFMGGLHQNEPKQLPKVFIILYLYHLIVRNYLKTIFLNLRYFIMCMQFLLTWIFGLLFRLRQIL